MYRYLLLGLLQGFTEFLPVSSSGHLVLAERLLGLDPPGVLLEVVLHLGTLAAVLVYFWGDLSRLLRRGVSPTGRGERAYIGLLVLATVPIALVGFFARDWVERAFSSPELVGWMLIVTAGALGLASLWQCRAHRQTVGTLDALAVGLAQTFALLPGISRSGITIAAGIVRGLSPREAARFSFLLSIPAVAGAGILSLASGEFPAEGGIGLALGGAAAMASGLLAVHLLLKLLLRGRLWLFALYCLLVGTISLITLG